MLKTIPELVAEARTGVRCMEAEQAIAEARKNGGTVIDVREPPEVEQSPVPGSLNLPRSVLEMQALAQIPDPQTPLYLHCASGVRASLAAEQLQRLGYENVTVITCDADKVRNAVSSNPAGLSS